MDGIRAGSRTTYPLTQIFDDVWFVGNHYVGQYLIKTADGLVQVDSGNNAGEVASQMATSFISAEFGRWLTEAASNATDADVREFYLGVGSEGDAKSFKELKHYKRRKRWLS